MRLLVSGTTLLWMAFATSSAHAFSQSARTSIVFTPKSSTKLHEKNPTLSEKELRKVIEDRNTKVDGDENYITTVGEGVQDDGEISNAVTNSSTDSETASILEKKIERILKPRAYPLFLMEKAAIIVEDLLASISMDDQETTSPNQTEKEKIVILGTGWGSAAFLKEIDTDKYDVTVISPRNFFLFTPMLAGSSVGTVEYRSITEPIREINRKAGYLEGTATNIDIENKTVFCESVVCEGNSCTIEDFDVQYDKLIFAVGAQTNTFGIPGVREYCCFLKQVDDARRIRTALVNCFERANLPNLTDEKREAILTFAVIGAGPTGVEFASELRDFVEQDGPKYYPNLLKHVRIKVIEASPTVLAPFDKTLQEEAVRQLTRKIMPKDPSYVDLMPANFELTELLLNSGVSEVKKDVIALDDGREIPYGMAVWAAGNGPLPITLQLIDSLKDKKQQADVQSLARGRIAIDSWLRVLGSDGSIMGLGDASCVVAGQLPATAQVAGQQGEYLGRLLSLNYDTSPGIDPTNKFLLPPKPNPNREKTFAEKITAFATQSDEFAAPFQFLNLGILAYTGGGSALAQIELLPSGDKKVKGSGKIGFGLW
eukprot:CAMPEP_0197825468 /NCGR_PEP_ID=MMETSP1437-20131217/2537_1 /TAXON_ID=49252 ORGANISM="Eucampia antarctica, Strain CCMP1452" /NCGR_SAMPLE_ID=MMETSP1437 /ASSEMBLY_ACC=CAM_ASM_001096 /LENGTH=598 /DNA_ID=CAMNT_0043425471 /DNA_START=83 /DNA_END=1876 /DNA_ORIENTATION=-